MRAQLAASARLRERRLRLGHWLLFGFGLAVLVAMLVLQGISAHRVGASGTAPDMTSAAAPLAGTGPAFAWQNGAFRSRPAAPRKTIALTFDDGPSRYTPQIVRILKRYRVPATFFEIGTQAVRFPGYTRLVAPFDGHGAAYRDDVRSAATSEPTDDASALALVAFAERASGAP